MEKDTLAPEEHQLKIIRIVVSLIAGVGMFIFMRTTGYDPFPVCTCGEINLDSALVSRAKQGDTLVSDYLETESSDLMCAARKRELLKKLEQRAKRQQTVDN